MSTKIHMGDALKRARIDSDCTQVELAEKCGVSQTNVSAWERRKSLKAETLEKVSKALGVSIENILQGKGKSR